MADENSTNETSEQAEGKNIEMPSPALMCTECHAEAKAVMPDGWVDSATASAREQAIYS